MLNFDISELVNIDASHMPNPLRISILPCKAMAYLLVGVILSIECVRGQTSMILAQPLDICLADVHFTSHLIFNIFLKYYKETESQQTSTNICLQIIFK